MQDEGASSTRSAAAEPPEPGIPRRVGRGMTRPHNWYQLVKFCAVGASGYAVNLAVFTLCVTLLDFHHLLAATLAFIAAVTNNFWWNRHWTFGAREGHAGFQAARFLTVSVLAFLFQAGMLQLLIVVGGLPEIGAQAISIVMATPLNFVGNKMWSFARARG
jgi:dolichol-phosphate mannosyltransferase